ncbi:MAG: hypothetical protein C0609_04850 [Deltaproteobacteria bacterium]|nr:MAG: hypothetical protein C0609_04850 [Deltaproteobacteria bacterium]
MAAKSTDSSKSGRSAKTTRRHKKESNFPERGFPIVGIGASAGGLEALEKFFSNMPPDSGMAFVIVTHLDPNHKSLLSELLDRYTRMTVQKAEEGMEILPDNIYVIPANNDLLIKHGLLHLEQPTAPRGHRQPVDSFLRSLASDQGDNSIAVILSGTGSDGTLGVKAIKEAGGIVVVQDAESAKYPGMPQSASQTGVADLELAAEDIPGKLIEYISNAESLARRKKEGLGQDELSRRIEQVFKIVDKVTGHNFNNYKINTLLRRVERRMAVNGYESMEDYTKFLGANEEEARALFKDVLIGVTSFFRDPEAYEILEKVVVPKLMLKCKEDGVLRVWVAGCATGEEAYSIAILFREYSSRTKSHCKIQIFATDIDEGAIATARAGIYPDSIAADVSSERLNRFFVRKEGRYQVVPSVRELIVFAPHNLLRDPPFSKLDLLCCRNLLIYLEPDIQRKIIPMMHQSLNEGGVLFLGTSETVGPHTSLFSTSEKKYKIYSRLEPLSPVDVDFPMHYEHRKRDNNPELSLPKSREPVNIGVVAERALLNLYAPPAVVINDKFQIVHYSTKTSRFLEAPVGEPTNDILKMVKEELRPALRAAVHKAITDKEPAAYENIRLGSGPDAALVDLRVEPFKEPASIGGLALVTFEDAAKRKYSQKTNALTQKSTVPPGSASDTMVRQLEEQLRLNQLELQSTVEELETSNEELKSSNEELMSMNEELQSSNEELETSKEELQALNEELVTVNSELQSKVEELAVANSDMNNLINSSRVATLFLDRDLKIKRFTPAMSDVFNLIDSDIGRPAAHITSKVDYPTFVDDVVAVLKNLEPIEREVSISNGGFFLVKVLPYRTIEDSIEGVVATFTDVTDLKAKEDELFREKALISAIMDTTDAMLLYFDNDFNLISANKAYEKACGVKIKNLVGHDQFSFFSGDDDIEIFKRVRDEGKPLSIKDKPFEFYNDPERDMTYWDWTLSPVNDSEGAVSGMVLTLRETTGRVEAIEELKESEQRHRIMGEIIPYGVWLTDAQGKARYISDSWCDMVGMTLEEAIEFGWLDKLVEEQRKDVVKLWNNSVSSGKPFEHEHRFYATDGTIKTVLARGLPIKNSEGAVTAWAGINLDITERKKEEEERIHLSKKLQESKKLEALGTLSGGVAHEFNNILSVVLGYAHHAALSAPDIADSKQRDDFTTSLNAIINSSNRAVDLVKQIMAYGKTSDPNRKSYNISQIIYEVVNEVLKSNAYGPDIEIGAVDDSCLVKADVTQVSQVIFNLLVNAQSATDKGGAKVKIDAQCVTLDAKTREALGGLKGKNFVRINVTDRGTGMTDEVKERIFEPFFSTKPTGEGSGLGLSVVYSYIKANGGGIAVESEPGTGTKFSIFFPQSSEKPAKITSAKRPKKLTGSGTIIYIEDEPSILKLFKSLLEKAGFTVEAFSSPNDALSEYQKNPAAYNAIVTDEKMPGMLGHELSQRVRNTDKNIPIILLTGHSDKLTKETAHEYGINGFFNKPVSVGSVIGMLNKLIEEQRDS